MQEPHRVDSLLPSIRVAAPYANRLHFAVSSCGVSCCVNPDALFSVWCSSPHRSWRMSFSAATRLIVLFLLRRFLQMPRCIASSRDASVALRLPNARFFRSPSSRRFSQLPAVPRRDASAPRSRLVTSSCATPLLPVLISQLLAATSLSAAFVLQLPAVTSLSIVFASQLPAAMSPGDRFCRITGFFTILWQKWRMLDRFWDAAPVLGSVYASKISNCLIKLVLKRG